MAWIETVRDRTAEDVERVAVLALKQWEEFSDEEKTAWLRGMKGALNLSDIERIQNDIAEISNHMEMGLTVSSVPDIPIIAIFDEIRTNIDKIRQLGFIRRTTPAVPLMPLNDWQKWNDVETILQDVYELINSVAIWYAGSEIFAGDTVGWLL